MAYCECEHFMEVGAELREMKSFSEEYTAESLAGPSVLDSQAAKPRPWLCMHVCLGMCLCTCKYVHVCVCVSECACVPLGRAALLRCFNY